MRQLFIEIAPKCLTYGAQNNMIQECRVKFPENNWNEVVHVQVIETHNDPNMKIANEFEDADFENGSDDETEDEEFNIDEAENYDVFQEKEEKKAVKVILEDAEEETTAEEPLKKSEEKEETSKQGNLVSNLTKLKEAQTIPKQEQPEAKTELPLALRKLKKKLKEVQ